MFISRSLASLALVLATSISASAQAQSQPDSPGVKFVEFGRAFFKSHRTGALNHWHEHFRNPNSELDGEWHTELHRGFRFEFIRGDGYKKDELGRLVITDPSIRLPLGVSLGATREQIIQRFGKPDAVKENSIEYELSYEMSFLLFRFTRERLIEIEVSIDHE